MANIRRSSQQSSGGKMYVVKLVYLAYNIRLLELNCKFSLSLSVCLSLCLCLSVCLSLSLFQNMLYTFYHVRMPVSVSPFGWMCITVHAPLPCMLIHSIGKFGLSHRIAVLLRM